MEDIGVISLNAEVTLFCIICIVEETMPSFYSKLKRVANSDWFNRTGAVPNSSCTIST